MQGIFKYLFEIDKPINLSLYLSSQMLSQEMLIDLVSKIYDSDNIFVKNLNLRFVETQTKESLFMVSRLIQKKIIEEFDFSGLESDDEFITEMINALEKDPKNPLRSISLGEISSFSFEYIAHNINFLANLNVLEFKESPNDLFSEKVKELFFQNLKENKGNLLFCNICFEDSTDKYFNKLIEFNENARRLKLEKEEEKLIQREYCKNVLKDISHINKKRIFHSFSEKNYLESVFGDKLEKSIFEIKNFQEKSKKQLEKLLMNCSDEPEFEVDDNHFTSDGFSLLLCNKLIEKFGLTIPPEIDEVENVKLI